MGKFDNINVSFHLASETLNEDEEAESDWFKDIFFVEPKEMTLGLS